MNSIKEAFRRVNQTREDPALLLPVRVYPRTGRRRNRLPLFLALAITVALFSFLIWVFWPAESEHRAEVSSGRLPEASQVPERPLVTVSLPKQNKLPPATVQEHLQEGQLAQDRGQPALALYHYRRAVALKPGLAVAYLSIGNIYFFHFGHKDQARDMYKTVLMLDPGNKMAHNNLGVVLLSQGLLDEADESFQAALKQDPQYVDALYNMACLAARRGWPEQVISYLVKAQLLRPEVSDWAAKDADFQELRDHPLFKSFLDTALGPRS